MDGKGMLTGKTTISMNKYDIIKYTKFHLNRFISLASVFKPVFQSAQTNFHTYILYATT